MESPPPTSERDLPRRLLVAYLLLWLGEGPLRKWVLPSLQQPLYFVRFIVVLAALGFVVRRLRRPWPMGAVFGVLYILAIVVITAAHLVMGDQSLIGAALGTRLWLEVFLMPLALGPFLASSDAWRATQVIIALTFPVAVLATVQVASPRTAWVNKLLAEDGSDAFILENGVVRASGLFTSSFGHSCFIVLAMAAALAPIMAPSASPRWRVLATAALPVVALMAATSGSRSAVFGCGLVLVFALPSLARAGQARLAGAGLMLAGAVVLALLVAPRLAPDAVSGILGRVSGNGLVSEPQSRVVDFTFGWVDLANGAPALGAGLGSTAQGLGNLGVTGYTESEFSQWMVQLGPALFVLALAVRWSACVALALRALRASGRGLPQALPFVGACLFQAVNGTATNQGSVNGFVVVSALLAIGASRAVAHQSEGADATADSTMSGSAAAAILVGRAGRG